MEVSWIVGRYEDTYAACPYYKRDDKQMICCEGVEPGTVIRLAFSSAVRRREYKNQFCRGCWGQCRVAQMQNQRYGYK